MLTKIVIVGIFLTPSMKIVLVGAIVLITITLILGAYITIRFFTAGDG